MRTISVFLMIFLFPAAFSFASEIGESSQPDALETYPNFQDPEFPASEGTDEQKERVLFLIDASLLYAAEGAYEEALQACLRALEVLPGNQDIRFRLSTLYIQMQNYREAAHLLREMIAEFPDNPQIHNNLAWVYATGAGVKNGELALYHAREAVLLAPIQPSIWNTLAEAYFVSGQYEQALKTSVHAFDLLQAQRQGNEQEAGDFLAQQEKIRRADEAYKRFMGIDE